MNIRHNLLVRHVRKIYYLCNANILKYIGVLTWAFVVAFCYDMLYEPCDGFNDSLPVLLVFYGTLGVLLLIVICGLKIGFSWKYLK